MMDDGKIHPPPKKKKGGGEGNIRINDIIQISSIIW